MNAFNEFLSFAICNHSIILYHQVESENYCTSPLLEPDNKETLSQSVVSHPSFHLVSPPPSPRPAPNACPAGPLTTRDPNWQSTKSRDGNL